MKTDGGELPSISLPISTDFICVVAEVSCLRYAPFPIMVLSDIIRPYVKGFGAGGESVHGWGKVEFPQKRGVPDPDVTNPVKINKDS